MKTSLFASLGLLFVAFHPGYAAEPCSGTYRIGTNAQDIRHMELRVDDGEDEGLSDLWHLNQYLDPYERTLKYSYGELEIAKFRCNPDSEYFLEFDVHFWASFPKFYEEIPSSPGGGTCWDQMPYECPPVVGQPAHWGEGIDKRPYHCRMNRTSVECSPLNSDDKPGRFVLTIEGK